MSAPPLWVVGSHGLLGSAVVRAAHRQDRSVHVSSVPWEEPDRAVATLLADAARLVAHDDLAVAWCAGAGVVATSAESLRAEQDTYAAFVDGFTDLVRGHGTALTYFLASSAGGVYADSGRAAEPPFTEDTPPAPASPYGEVKLAAEARTRRLADDVGARVLLGRIANLYGPGQDLTKPQGLVTQLCRAHVDRTPLQIYVSLDTRRDYVFVDDAARVALAGLDAVTAGPPGSLVTKIIASGLPTTLGAILGELRRVTRSRPQIVLGTSPFGRFQSRDLRFRSVVLPELDALVTTTLPAGVAASLEAVAAERRVPRAVS